VAASPLAIVAALSVIRPATTASRSSERVYGSGCGPRSTPASPVAGAVVTELVGRYAQVFGDADSTDYRAGLLTRLEIGGDPRVERYWQLLAIINGWPAPPALAPVFAWFSEALRQHPAP
jgi:hypothetical protein